MARPVRRNLAHLTAAEREHFADVVRQIDLRTYSDGVSYWDKQDQIHQSTHNHGGNSFIPWHRELCNRFERLLQQVDPDIALHYWDWTTDPRATPNAAGAPQDLMTDAEMGTAGGIVAGTLGSLHNNDVEAGSRGDTGNPADPPQVIRRDCALGAPGVAADSTIITGADGAPQDQQWAQFRVTLEGSHNTAHTFFGAGSNIGFAHTAFEDPFVFLIHSNVDRLWAMWQTASGQDWRLDPDLVYGDQSNTSNSTGVLHSLQPWDGTVEFGAAIPPWTGDSSEIEVKNCRHPSVVAPPCYDTLPLTVEQVAPIPGQPIRFVDVFEELPTARALRLRVRGCRTVTCNAILGGDPAFTLSSAVVRSPDVDAFGVEDVLVWVIFAPGPAGSSATGSLQVTVPESGDSFTVSIQATVIARPTVATSLVLDRSGSMDEPSGIPGQSRLEILKTAAPLYVHLLDDDDGIGIVRFDTDAIAEGTIQVAGPQIGGAGRNEALDKIAAHSTDPAGLTAIGDGVEAASAQLSGTPASIPRKAMVVFTDGHETASKRISEVGDLLGERIFAIGLGTADELNPGALDDLVSGTGGYLLLTGNPGPDDQTLLQKYFAQVLAGVTNGTIIVDPAGFVPIDGEAVVPYDVTASDVRTDVILLSPAARAIELSLEAPDGSIVDGTNGAVEVRDVSHTVLRGIVPVPGRPTAGAGRWRAHLKVRSTDLDRWLETALAHGLPFTLSVQARSALRLDIAVARTSRRPGSHATITATLSDAGIPLGHAAVVEAVLTRPDGSNSTLRLRGNGDGVYGGDTEALNVGVYRVLVRAKGSTLRGEPFTREELRTLGVWNRGDSLPQPPPTTDCDPCALIARVVGRLCGCVKQRHR
ncbi:tyrosinase family protein [Nocardia sp. NPDC050713]|uniref:tyrosinase family protein n=1 Tax=Nocardia sp. NPDC050713 TaxID=3154511 RepID=UPI0033FB7FA2